MLQLRNPANTVSPGIACKVLQGWESVKTRVVGQESPAGITAVDKVQPSFLNVSATPQDDMPPAYTLSEISAALNRPAVFISGLQDRFELPAFDGAGYSGAYLEFLRVLVSLRALAISEDRLLGLWTLEKKLLHLIHADSTGSATWFLDSCGRTNNLRHRLLLTNCDLGAPIPAHEIQLGLNFSKTEPELFAGTEMGEDALRVLNHIIPLHSGILKDIAAELPHLRRTAKWAARLSAKTSARLSE